MKNKKALETREENGVSEWIVLFEEFPRYSLENYMLRLVRLDESVVTFWLEKNSSDAGNQEKLMLMLSDVNELDMFKLVVAFKDYFKAAFNSNEFNLVSIFPYDEFVTFYCNNCEKITALAEKKEGKRI